MQYVYAMINTNNSIMQVLTTPYLHVECDSEVDDTTHYYNSELQQLELRKEITYDLVVNDLSVTISNLPVGLKVKSNGMETITDDTDLEIEYDIPGAYQIEIYGRVDYLTTSFFVDVSTLSDNEDEAGGV